MDYYIPAYIGLISASIGVVALPVHLTGYRERRVLRRFRASSISIWAVFGSQVVVSLAISILGALLLIAAALVAYDASLPESPGLVVVAFVLSVLSFAAVGVFLGAILPTTRAAQGLGLILFFVMMILSGAGPPREVMTEAMHWIADATPLRYVVLTLQDPWLGFGWNVHASLVVGGFLVAATLLSARFFRWE